MHPWLWGFLKQPSGSLWMTPAAVWRHLQEQLLPAKQQFLLKAKRIWLFLLLSSLIDAVLIFLLCWCCVCFEFSRYVWLLLAAFCLNSDIYTRHCVHWYSEYRSFVWSWVHQRCAAIMSAICRSEIFCVAPVYHCCRLTVLMFVTLWYACCHFPTTLVWPHMQIWSWWNKPLLASCNKCACLHVEAYCKAYCCVPRLHQNTLGPATASIELRARGKWKAWQQLCVAAFKMKLI